MPEFSYTALTQTGQRVSGEISAATRPAAVELLKAQGSFVVEIGDRGSTGRARSTAGSKSGAAGFSMPWFGRRVSGRQRAGMFRQLAVALDAGLNLAPALEVIRDQAESEAMRTLVSDLLEDVKSGTSLSAAMIDQGAAFSKMQASMVQAGETAGLLDEVMTSLASFAERDVELREKLRSAAIYPLMVMGLGVLSIVVILVFILPRIMETITTAASELPLPTRIVLGGSELLRSPGGILAVLAIIAAGVFAWRWSRTEVGLYRVDEWKLKLPLLGQAFRRVAVARFARTLGTLTAAGIQVVEAMAIVRNTLGNEAMARQVDLATEEIMRGRSITEPLKASGYFPGLLIQVIAMGEQTGKLDELLLRCADSYDKETEAALQRLMAVLPVLLIVCLAVFVAFILAAALLPIMTMDMGG